MLKKKKGGVQWEGRGEEPQGILERGVAFLTALIGMLSQRRGVCSTNYFVFSRVVIAVTISLSPRATCSLFRRFLAFCYSGIQGREDKGEDGSFQVSVSVPFENKTKADAASPFRGPALDS